MGNKILIAILASLSLVTAAHAEEGMEGGEKKPFSVYGDLAVNASFHDNEGNFAARTPGFGNHDDFALALAEINFEKNWSSSQLHLGLGFGNTLAMINPTTLSKYGATGNSPALNLTNAYYKLNSSYGLSFKVGKFESPFGHETYNHMDNSQFTRSYGYMLSPWFQAGVGVNYTSGMFDVGLIVSNGSQSEGFDSNENNKAIGLTVAVNPMDNLAIDLGYLTSKESADTNNDNTFAGDSELFSVTMTDISVAYMINEMFDVAINYVSNEIQAKATGSTSETANSIAIYGNANLGMYGLGLRYEQFSYDDGAAFSKITYGNPGVAGKTENKISSITLTGTADIDQNAKFVLEYRMDSSDEKIWTDKDNTATDGQNTITAAVMYRF